MDNLKIHHIKGYIQTIYLVQNKENLFLLDGGCRCDVENVKKYIEDELNKKIDDLKLVIVTHAHPDHSGGAYFFQKRYGIKIAGPENINDWYRGISGFSTYFIDLLLTYMVAMRKTGHFRNILFPRKQNLDFIFKDNSFIPGLEGWQVLSCPGHTAVDLTLYNEKEKIAYVADNLVGGEKNIFRPYPLSFPNKYKEALQRYLDLDIQRYLLAHYGEVSVSREKIEFLIETTPHIARVHKNTLPTIMKHLFKSFFRSKK